MTVTYDPDELCWVFDGADTAGGALVSVSVDGVEWVTSTVDHTEPCRVTVAEPPSQWARGLISNLLGDDAAEAISVGVDDTEVDGHERRVRIDPSASKRRGSMGLLAIATAGVRNTPLRAIDITALAHRCGLDSLGVPMPGAERIADAALEAIDLLPSPVMTGIDTPIDDDPHVGWRAAAAGLADTRAFIASATGDLLAGRDVDSTFAAIVDGADLLIDEELPMFLGGGEPVWRGGPPMPATTVTAIDVRVLDPSIQGVATVAARYDTDTSTATVAVRTRSGAPRLQARLVDADAVHVIGTSRLSFDPAGPTPGEGTATFVVPSGVTPGRVDIVIDAHQPVVDDITARDLDASYRMREGERLLRQLAALEGDTDIDAFRRNIDETLRTTRSEGGLELDADILSRSRIEPLPSDGLIAVIGDLAAAVTESVEAVTSPTERAARAHNVCLLLADATIPKAQQLVGELSMLEAATRRQANGTRRSELEALSRARTAFRASGDDKRAEDVRLEIIASGMSDL